MALAEKRGNSVVKYLIEQGVHKTRLKSQGFGEAKPLADNSSAEGRALNRRVEFEIIFEDSKHKK
jgi:OOP family OmpA-OmpF porin